MESARSDFRNTGTVGGPGPETLGARLLNSGMAEQQESSGNNPAPNVLPRMKVCPVGDCTAGKGRDRNQVSEVDKDKDILNGEERSWRNSPMTLGAAQIWFSAPWEEDPDDSTSHTGSDIDWVLSLLFQPPLTWAWEGLAQKSWMRGTFWQSGG